MTMEVKDWIELVGQIVQAGLIGAGLYWTTKGWKRSYEFTLESQKENWRIQILDRAGFSIYRSLTAYDDTMRSLARALSTLGNPTLFSQLGGSGITPDNWKDVLNSVLEAYIEKSKNVREILDNIQYYKKALSNIDTENYIVNLLTEIDGFNVAFNSLKKNGLNTTTEVMDLWHQMKDFVLLYNKTSQSISEFRLKVGEHCISQVFHKPIQI
jgi:hypothetical protein